MDCEANRERPDWGGGESRLGAYDNPDWEGDEWIVGTSDKPDWEGDEWIVGTSDNPDWEGDELTIGAYDNPDWDWWTGGDSLLETSDKPDDWGGGELRFGTRDKPECWDGARFSLGGETRSASDWEERIRPAWGADCIDTVRKGGEIPDVTVLWLVNKSSEETSANPEFPPDTNIEDWNEVEW